MKDEVCGNRRWPLHQRALVEMPTDGVGLTKSQFYLWLLMG